MSSTETFTTSLPSMQYKRGNHIAAALGRKIFVVGGILEGQSTAECYDIDTQQWNKNKTKFGKIRAGSAAVSLGNDIIVMGGLGSSSAEIYNATSGRWSSFPSMNEERCNCAAAILNGKIVVVGGYRGIFNTKLSSGEEYDPNTGVWSSIPPMHHKRDGCAAAVLDGQLYVVGGYDGKERLSSAEVYNPNTKCWSLIPNMSLKRSLCAAVSFCGRLIVVGGFDGKQSFASCEAYDPSTCLWSSISAMQTRRHACAAVEVDGTLYVMGGIDGKTIFSSIESLKLPTPSPKNQPSPQEGNSSNRFFAKIFEKDDRNILFKFEELMNIVEDVHQMKFLYTYINSSYRISMINQEDRKRYITGSLEKVASSTTCHDAIAIFKKFLGKAKQDDVISDHEYFSLESKAVVAHVGAAPFVKEIWESIYNLQTRVDGLENRLDVLDSKVKRLEQVSANIVESLSILQEGILRKKKIEAVTGMMSAVLNVISLGTAGFIFEGAMGSVISDIVDFGDISHIQTVVETFGDSAVKKAFQNGIDAVANKTLYKASEKSRAKLYEPTVDDFVAAANEGNPLFAIVVTAQLITHAAPDMIEEEKVLPTPPSPLQTSTVSLLDALEEAVGIEKSSSAIKKRVEALEMSWFGDLQEGALKKRVSKLESEIL